MRTSLVALASVAMVASPPLLQAQPATQSATRSGRAPSIGDRVVAAAEQHLGKPYVFGGRAGRPGCRADGKRVRCQPGIDCQSLIFFAFEQVCGRSWTSFSVMPSVSARRGELGDPVPGLDGVLRGELDAAKLQPGDVLFFMLEDYNLEADTPLMERAGRRYGVWHTGLFHGADGEVLNVIHARPGDQVVVEPIGAISFDAIYVLRTPAPGRCPRSRR